MTDDIKHSLPAGTVLNEKWVILEFIAKGGMGEIYRAHQLNLKRDVAIKIISKEWLDDIEEDEEEIENAFRRFQQEVQIMAQIRHPNVIQIYDFDKTTLKLGGENVDIEYIALEYVPGRTLKDTMSEEGFYPEEDKTISWLTRVFSRVLEGVHAIHDAGILHRDLKPANVLMDGDIPKIADFGLARSGKMASMTCSLEVKGSPSYMAPEQFIDFKGTDQRTDIYSLGKIIYEAVDGKIPEKTIPFRQAKLKEAETPFWKKINTIIRKATDERPENRYQSIEELQAAVQDVVAFYNSTVRNKEYGKRAAGKGLHLSRRVIMVLSVAGIVFAALIAFWGYHSIKEHFGKKVDGSVTTEIKPATLKYPEDVPMEASTPDGTVLRLVPGGDFRLPVYITGSAEVNVRVNPFYMDKTPVTNQQFVEFLNTISEGLTVEDEAVKKDGAIYLYLGEAVQGYEPIIFENGMFWVKHPSHSSCPVVRVTGYGASAYAAFYGRRLPTATEWLYAALDGNLFSVDTVVTLPKSLVDEVKFPTPVMLLPENVFGIKGLNVNLGCWVSYKLNQKNSQQKLAILGGFDTGAVVRRQLPTPVKRKPWEAFEEVGFRCVMDVEGG